MESATARMQLLSQLEDQLRKLSFTDPAVREVRKQVRAAAESVLLATYAAAQVQRDPRRSLHDLCRVSCPSKNRAEE